MEKQPVKKTEQKPVTDTLQREVSRIAEQVKVSQWTRPSKDKPSDRIE